MNKGTVFKKTAKGNEEAENRTYKIDIRSRAALLTVNGTDAVETILKRFHGLDQIMDLLTKLEKDGFIEQVAAPRASSAVAPLGDFNRVLRTVVAMIHDLLGPDGDAVTEKLEDIGRAGNSTVVMQFLEKRRGMFEDIAGKQKAAHLFDQVHKLLGLEPSSK